MLLKGITALALVCAVLQTLGGPIWWFPLYLAGYWLAFLVAVCLFLLVACLFVDMKKPRQKESKFFRTVLYPYVEMLLTLFRVTITTEGMEKTPTDGRFLLVSNHQSAFDPGAFFHCFPKSQLIFVAKKEVADMPVINKVLHALCCQMVDRENDRQALRMILNCVKIIKEDQASVAVFPEGYTSMDGLVHHFRNGVFKIAQKADVPIVVCTVKGTGTLAENLLKYKPTKVAVHLLDVIGPEELKGKTTAEIGDRIYEMMIADLGEEFRSEA